MIKLSKILLICTLAAALGLSACEREPSNPLAPKGEVVMTLTTSLPAPTAPETRAITSANEQTLTAGVKIVAFNTSTGAYLYVRDGAVSNVNANATTGGGTATIKFSSPLSTTGVSFVVIANANSDVTTALSGNPNKTAFLGHTSLCKELPAGTAWKANSSSDFDAIPLFGEASVASISAPATVLLTLTRMLARINVTSTIAATTFKMNSVRVYNTNRGGYIAPNITPIKSGWPFLHNAGTGDHLLYNLSTTEQTNRALTNTIYTFERSGVTAASPVILVVGGRYNNHATTDSYYKVILATGASSYVSLARNSSYNVTINAVTYDGYATPEEAFNSTGQNLSASITVWNDQNVTVADNGKYFLGVNEGIFELSSAARTTASVDNKLIIRTNHPSGWSAAAYTTLTGTTTATWLTLSPFSGTGAGTGTSVSLVMSANTTSSARTAYVHITVGLLTYKVQVTQNKP